MLFFFRHEYVPSLLHPELELLSRPDTWFLSRYPTPIFSSRTPISGSPRRPPCLRSPNSSRTLPRSLQNLLSTYSWSRITAIGNNSLNCVPQQKSAQIVRYCLIVFNCFVLKQNCASTQGNGDNLLARDEMSIKRKILQVVHRKL